MASPAQEHVGEAFGHDPHLPRTEMPVGVFSGAKGRVEWPDPVEQFAAHEHERRAMRWMGPCEPGVPRPFLDVAQLGLPEVLQMAEAEIERRIPAEAFQLPLELGRRAYIGTCWGGCYVRGTRRQGP